MSVADGSCRLAVWIQLWITGQLGVRGLGTRCRQEGRRTMHMPSPNLRPYNTLEEEVAPTFLHMHGTPHPFSQLKLTQSLTCPRSPYDTLEEVIGLRGTPGHGSLMEWGIKYRELAMAPNGEIDWEALSKAIVPGRARLHGQLFGMGSMGQQPTTPYCVPTLELHC